MRACVTYERPGSYTGEPLARECRCVLRFAESTPGSDANPSSDDLYQLVSGVPDSDGYRGVHDWMFWNTPDSCYS